MVVSCLLRLVREKRSTYPVGEAVGCEVAHLMDVEFCFGGGLLLTSSTDGWMAVLFGCWLGGIDALVRWRVSCWCRASRAGDGTRLSLRGK